MAGVDGGRVGQREHGVHDRPLHRGGIGCREVDASDRPGEEGVTRKGKARLVVDEDRRTRTVPRRVQDPPARTGQFEGFAAGKERRRLGHPQVHRHHRTEVQQWIRAEASFGLVQVDRGVGEPLPHDVEARDVIDVCVRQHDCLRGEALADDVLDHRLRGKAAINDPAGCGAGRMHDEAVRLEFAEDECLDYKLGHGCSGAGGGRGVRGPDVECRVDYHTAVLIRRADEMDGQEVAIDGVKDVAMRLMVGRDDGAPTFAMRHFTVAPGGHTPHHSHNYEHEVYILNGQGTAESDGTLHTVAGGDALFVPANVLHQFVNTGDEPLEFLCFVPTQFDCGGGESAATPGS